MPAVLLTALPSCRPAFRLSCRPACRPAFLPTSLPACQFAWLSSRCHVFSPLLILPTGLPDYLFLLFYDSSIFFSLPTCRHADGCGRTFSHLLDLPACLPAGSPFSTLNISFSLPSCPACRTISFYFSMTHISFFLCRHAVMPMAAAIPSLISCTFLPACLPDQPFLGSGPEGDDVL